MPECKLCRKKVITGSVFHENCMENWVDDLMEVICEEYCKVTEIGGTELCGTCQIEEMLREILR